MQRVGIPMSSNIGGDVFESLAKLNDQIKKNDGIRSFSIKTNSCYDSDAPVSEGTQTHIRITNSYHDMNQLDETYLRCRWKMTVKIAKAITIAGVRHMKFFVGWKNSNEAIRQLEVENNNVDCDYLQTESAKEGFAYATYKPEEEKKNRKYAHSRWGNVEMGVPGVCGAYIDIAATTADNAVETVTFDTVIPINDLLAFQAFEEFPGCLGDIVLKLYFTSQSMVYGFCDPELAMEAVKFWDTSYGELAANTGKKETVGAWPYTRGFTQVGQSSIQPIATSDTANDNKVDVQTISVTSLELTNLYCDVSGYNITQECKRNIATMFTPEHPLIIPAQHMDVKNLPKKGGGGQYDADFTYALHNVTDFITVFPRTSQDTTCFYNPIIENLQLRCDGKLYPTHKIDSTTDYRFYQMMMNASDLDNYYEADKSYSNSLTTKIPVAFKNTCTPYDISSFICTFQCERNTKGYCFDGLETGNVNVNIGLQFNANATTSWYGTADRASPQIWFARDTYWTVDNVNGLKYHKTGTPPIYASTED